MPPLTDPERLTCYQNALAQWNTTGYVNFLDGPLRWLRKELAGISPPEVKRLLHDYVVGGGQIDEVVETRETWRDRYEYHYDLRVRIDGRLIYFETRLVPSRTGPEIYVVNIHDA
jgi:hypothetical protein